MTENRHKRHDPLVGLSIAILFVLVTLTMAQVILRTIFNYPLIGAEELARYFLICIVFIGTPIAAADRIHISMVEIQSRFPLRLRTVIEWLIQISWLAVFSVLSVSVLTALVHNIDNRTVNLGIPAYIFLAPTVIGFVATAFISGRNIVIDTIRLRKRA